MHYFKFQFPDALKSLPRRIRYEVVSGNVGIISTEDQSIISALSRIGCVEQATIDAIREVIGNRKPMDQLERVPSFTLQTKWPCGFFKLPERPGVCYFNCGLERWDGALHLFTRRFSYARHPYNGTIIGDSDLAIFRLLPDLSVQSEIIPMGPNRYPGEQWEDPRALVTNGRCYVSVASWIKKLKWKVRQSLLLLSDDLSRFSVAAEPQIGGNHPNPLMASGHEKNWTWFGDCKIQGALRCVYNLYPLEIHAFDQSDEKSALVDCLTTPEIPWQHGTLRGGANPELADGEYWVFFHSSMPWNDAFGRAVMGTRRRYYMGALTFSSIPPFRLTSMTQKPLLTGSEEDPRVLEGPPVVFPCGAKLIDGSWLVTMGINDEKCGWISIPAQELKAVMSPVS